MFYTALPNLTPHVLPVTLIKWEIRSFIDASLGALRNKISTELGFL